MVLPGPLPRFLQPFRSILLLALLPFLAAGQPPVIAYRGILNAASFMPTGLPGGAIARGSIISIFGSFLGPNASPALAFPLQTTLGGVSVSLKQGSTVVNAIPLFVGPNQVNAIVPSDTPLGAVSLRVVTTGGSSNYAPVQIVNSAFGIVAVAAGRGPGVLQNFVSSTEQPVNSLTVPAKPGQTIILWGTGLGPVSYADNQPPNAGNLPVQTEVFVGGVPAKVAYSGRSPCCAATDQIVFEVPANAPLGCWVPVFVRTAGTVVSNSVTMAISSDGSACTEPANPAAQALIAGNRTGRVIAARIATHHDLGVAKTNDTIADVSSAYFAKEAASPFNFDPAISMPPPGACTTYAFSGDFSSNTGFPPGFPLPTATDRRLDTGLAALAVASSDTAIEYDATPGMTYFGASIPTIAQAGSLLYLNPGNFTLATKGGADVGAVQANFTMPPPFAWTNRDSLQTINRALGFTVSWSGVDNGDTIFVSGGAADLPTNSSSIFVCAAQPGDNSLTVPPYVLANIPATRARSIQSRGAVYVGEWPLANPARFSAVGIDSGVALPVQLLGKTVAFQ